MAVRRRRVATLPARRHVQTGPGAPGLGVLWFAARPYGDFSLRLQFRDDATAPAPRQQRRAGAVPGAQVADARLPDDVQRQRAEQPGVGRGQLRPRGPDQRLARRGADDPRKTGSIYGFADLDATQARVTAAGMWNDLEITVVGQHYTVIRNGVVINEYENVPGVPFPGRPNDPGSSSRGLVGYVGLQAHGGANDVVSFRNVRIRDLEVD